jgi:hypothetical protein
MRPLALALLLPLGPIGAVALTAPGCAGIEGKSCTLMACGDEGVTIDFSLRERGSYAIDVVVDGVETTCQATLPIDSERAACGGPAEGVVHLVVTGSRLPPEDQSIGPLTLATKDAKQVEVRISRDGALVAEKIFAPAYETSPGPNGPGCEPATCTSARTTLP